MLISIFLIFKQTGSTNIINLNWNLENQIIFSLALYKFLKIKKTQIKFIKLKFIKLINIIKRFNSTVIMLVFKEKKYYFVKFQRNISN